MLEDDPLWYKDAIIYELHVRSFHDAAGDGVGDFRGLTQKLDYLQDLGVSAIWILPFYPSPLKDDGYDIADYANIHPNYGRLEDFREFLEEAHRRNLRVITELVLNHTSDQHPWFQRARRSPPGSSERDFYVWSDTPDRYRDVRVIFQDFEHSNWAWDPVARAYFWHRFYSHQPDLNYDNPAVWKAIFPVVDFWLSLGVDGMRLDAVPYLYEREGTSCENLPETHDFLKALRRHVDGKFPNRMLLSEANQWPEDAVAYFGAADESHMAFHFPLMPRMFMAIHMEDRYPIMDIITQTPPIPESCQWCLFLRNHDELTLEMVTDEERDYMYRAYAGEPRARVNLGIRRRLAPLLGNNRRRIELMNGLLFSLPGTPVIYYGDEIGMGDNIYLGDRNGVRTPMQWSADRNAGFSRANPQKLFLPIIIDPEYHYEAINVEAQQNNPNSLLWWMKRLIALRRRYKAFGRGTLEFLQPANRRVLAFLRSYQNETILVAANLSRFVQHVELDLSRVQGCVPIELFGRNAFPRVGRNPYPLTLGPHAFYWFLLEAPKELHVATGPPAAHVPAISAPAGWMSAFRHPMREKLEAALAAYLTRCPWAGGPGRAVKSAAVRGAISWTLGDADVFHCLVEAEFTEGASESYQLPLAFAPAGPETTADEAIQSGVVASVDGKNAGVIFDALEWPRLTRAFLRGIAANLVVPGHEAEIFSSAFPALPPAAIDEDLPVRFVHEQQDNCCAVFGERLMLKLFRRVEEGIHPEVEMGRYLTEKAAFPHVAPIYGAVELRRRKHPPATLAVLQGYLANEGTAWQYTLDELSVYFERVLSLPAQQQPGPPPSILSLAPFDPPDNARELMGRYLESAALLGRRTAELHLALAAEKEDPAFAPEPFTPVYQRSAYQSMRNVHRRALEKLRLRLEELPEALQPDARKVLEAADEILQRLNAFLMRRIHAQRLRCHGDLNLCEIIYTGKDFLFIDFEGDRLRSLSDRRVKRSPLRDAAAMIRSFHYAAWSVLLGDGNRRGQAPGMIRREDVGVLLPWADYWFAWSAAAFLHHYRVTAAQGLFLPPDDEQLRTFLEAILLEKSLHEIWHELDRRPNWLAIPLGGILNLLHAR